MDYHFSVLMSVYIKEKPEYFRACMESIVNQTLPPDEIVLVLDGPITDELRHEIVSYQNSCRFPVVTVPLEQNKGLGLALAEGIKHCVYPLVARMDTDDICVPERFQKQIQEFQKDANLDIVGSHIKEYDLDFSNVLSMRKVPLKHEEICKYQRKRSAFNHMTVMFRKEAVLRAGNYKHAPLMEDDLLWCEMLKTGSIGKNIDEVLVNVRAGESMLKRRGGWSYFVKYCSGRKKILQTGYIGYFDYYLTCAVQLIVALVPNSIRKFIFLKLLR